VQDLNKYNAKRRQQGQEPKIYSDEQIATFLEEKAKEEYDAKEARRSRVRGPGQAASNTASGKSAGKVITSETANGSSQRAMTREEKRELILKSPWPT
jgi:hypothetical protein